MRALNEKLVQEALSLPLDMRTEFVDRLLESLNIPSQKAVDNLWAEEAEKRIAEVRSGKVKTIPGEQVFNNIRNKFKK